MDLGFNKTEPSLCSWTHVGDCELQGHAWVHSEQAAGALPHGGHQDGGARGRLSQGHLSQLF
jgi:hypothetical protein